MLAKRSRRLVSATQILLACLLAFGLYRFSIARNQGSIPEWLDDLLVIAWFVGVIALIIWQARRAEDTYIGNLREDKATLNADEEPVFKNSFMSGKFFPSGMAFNPEPHLLEWLSGGPVTVIRLLAVQVTNQRLIFKVCFFSGALGERSICPRSEMWLSSTASGLLRMVSLSNMSLTVRMRRSCSLRAPPEGGASRHPWTEH